ncbi:MAG: peptide ABC transporter substrate-binding protein [Armatimonadota bacterium]|nr:peptide ABC transporter substrate-binding protein [Armatimonadota bacterium]MDR7551002.1 peptide ABC transporter substrate-binding protein [Armatimonadota bacterium]
MRRLLLLIGGALLLMMVVQPASAQPRDTVIVGLIGEPDHIVPGFSRLAVTGYVTSTLFVGLVDLNADWQLFPRIAQEVPTLENGQWRLLPNDEMEVTYRLRPGFKWHDGTPVTAGDVVFAWEAMRERRTGAAQPDPGISAMTAPDASTVVVRWSARRLTANLGHPLLPRHLLEAQFRENPAGIRTGTFAARPVGNGPYRFVEWVRGRHIRLQAVEDYAEGRPKIPTLVFRFFASDAAVGNEELHVNAAVYRPSSDFETITPPSLVFEHIAVNLDNPWLRDRRVRQALLYALDRDLIRARAGWGPLTEVAHTWLPPRHPGHNADVRRYGRDVDLARRLLTEAGWTPGPDGIVRNAAGERLELVIMTTPGNTLRERTQDLLIEQWRAVGIAARKENPPNFFERLVRPRFPHLAMFAWVMTPMTDGYELWHSSRIPSEANRFQGSNYAGWSHAENDRLLDQIAQEIRESQRIQFQRRQQELWVEEVPSLPLWFRSIPVLVHRNLTGVRPAGVGGAFMWNVYEWAWRP